MTYGQTIEAIAANILAAQDAQCVLCEVNNESEGVTFVITKFAKNDFRVSLRDDDSGETLPTIKFFDNYSAASNYAHGIK